MQINSQQRNEFRRTLHPEETIRRIENKLEEMGIQTYFIEHNPAPHMWSIKLQAPDLRIGSNGKGTSRMEAAVSAYAELVERISIGMMCGIFLGAYRQLHGTASELITEVEFFKYADGYKWGHQDSLQDTMGIEEFLKGMPFTKGQFESAKMKSEFLRHWIPGYSLVQNRERLVPVLLTKWISATNGIASGNTMEEAIVHAACEIFERDALIKYLRHMNEVPAKTVIPESIPDSRIQEMLLWFKSRNIEVIIKDLSFDIYPVYAIMTFNHNMPEDKIGMNFIKSGSAMSSTEALMRCFTERMQGTSLEAEAGGDVAQQENVFENHQMYMPIMFSGICPFNLAPYKVEDEMVEFKEWELTDTKAEVDECIRIARGLDTDLVVLDHTHPVFNLPTCRVVMPGVSDFMKWWDPTKLTLDFIGNIQPEEDRYEEALIRLLRTFRKPHPMSHTASNKSRRDT
jgi:ribosomal protein S12 methylthiotransferase accessory factor